MLEHPANPAGSFMTCVEACALAKRANQAVCTTVFGTRVVAKPSDDPHYLYKHWCLAAPFK